MRVSGLSSGIDYESMIKKLMDAHRIPMTKLKQQKQMLEWKRDDYRTLNAKIMEFRNLSFNMRLEGTYLSKKASSSQESIVSVSGTPTANAGQYTIQIDRLATAASLNSGDLAGAPGGSKKMSDLGLTADTVLTIGGEKGTAGIAVKTTDSVNELVSKINNESSVTGVRVVYDETMDRLFFNSAKTGANSEITLRMQSTDESAPAAIDMLSTVFGIASDSNAKDAGQIIQGSVAFSDGSAVINKDMTAPQKLKISVDGGTAKEYTVSSTTTVNQLLTQINSDLGKTGITAYLDGSGKLSFFNPESKSLAFSSDGATDLIGKLGLEGPLTTIEDVDVSTRTIKGQNARVFFNNTEAFYDSNTFTIAGMTFTAKQASPTVVNVGITQDVDSVYNNIKTFVDKYNELIDLVNGELKEKKYRDFLPLTDEQKDAMKEDDIKRWEEKAKSGTLAGDRLLTSGLVDLRRALSDSISGLPIGQKKSLADIGISSTLVSGNLITGSYEDRGKLYIDETKLKEAIAQSPDEVMAIFNTNDGVDDSSAGDGIAIRLYNKASAIVEQITSRAGTKDMIETRYTMGEELLDYEDRMTALTRRLEDLETRYYKQFTAMETYLNRMNSQSAWLAQQFSTGG